MPTVLVVDDSVTTRKVVIESIQDAGFERCEFIEASDDAEALEELSRHLRVMTIGHQVVRDPARFERMKKKMLETWAYSVCGRSNDYLSTHRGYIIRWPLQNGLVGTGFWEWSTGSGGVTLWYDSEKYSRYAATYKDHVGVLSSLRAEAFREGIEDWKYLIMLDDAIAGAEAMAKPPNPAVSVTVLSPMSGLASAAEKPGR